MIAAKVEGIEGTVWMDTSALSPSDYRHPPLSKTVRDPLQEIKAALDEVYCLTLEQWEDGFRRDIDAEKEIALWLHISNVYRELTSGRGLAMEQKKDHFKVLLACSHSPREHVLKVVERLAISPEGAREAIAACYHDR
jgi:hypothetical protein